MRNNCCHFVLAAAITVAVAACGSGEPTAESIGGDTSSGPLSPTSAVSEVSATTLTEPALSDHISVNGAVAVLEAIRRNSVEAALGGSDQAGEGPCPLDPLLDISTVSADNADVFEETWWFEQNAIICFLGLPPESDEAPQPDTIGVVSLAETGGDLFEAFFGDESSPIRDAGAPFRGGTIQRACTAEKCVTAWSSGDLAVIYTTVTGTPAEASVSAITSRLDTIIDNLSQFDPITLDYTDNGRA